jgi:hypothetical protein
VSVLDFRCHAARGDKPFAERHEAFSIAYVRSGSFGYRGHGGSFEMVAGSLLVGHPGDEYVCTHDHAQGDECLAFFFADELVAGLDDRAAIWRTNRVPPLPDLMVVGELAQAAATGDSDVALDEAALLLASRFVRAVAGADRAGSSARRAIAAAPWRPRSGWTPTPTSRSTSSAPRAPPA